MHLDPPGRNNTTFILQLRLLIMAAVRPRPSYISRMGRGMIFAIDSAGIWLDGNEWGIGVVATIAGTHHTTINLWSGF